MMLQRVEKSVSCSGMVQTVCIWSGSTTHASMVKGRSDFVCRTASRKAATSCINKSDPRYARLTVKNTVAPGCLGRR